MRQSPEEARKKKEENERKRGRDGYARMNVRGVTHRPPRLLVAAAIAVIAVAALGSLLLRYGDRG